MHSDLEESSASDEAVEWFSKLRSGLATPDEVRAFECWRSRSPAHARAYAEVEQLWSLLEKPARQVFDREEAQAPVRHGRAPLRPRLASLRKGTPLRYALAGLSLAAITALFLCLPEGLRLWTSDYHTRWGEQREWVLEDGSRVMLNSHSALAVEFSPEQRKISLLEGEAYFQVAHNPARPFVVATAHGVAKVTGTAFNVYAHPERTTVTVTVAEGRVRVYDEGDQDRAVELTPGLQVSGDRVNGIGPVLRVDVRQASLWREGLLIFDMQPLAAVVEELNRYFAQKIVIADPRIGQRVVSGAFDMTRPQDILPAFEKILGLGSLEIPGMLTLLYQPGF